METMPLVNTHILGATSLWVGIPAYYATLRAYRESDPRLATLACTLVSIGVVSTLFWSRPLTDSPLHYADRFLCWLLVLELVVWFGAASGLWLASLILVAYVLSRVAYQRAQWRAQLAAHLLFRFAFYWSVHWSVLPQATWLDFALLTIGYTAPVLLLHQSLHWPASPTMATQSEQYALACAALACWIWLHGYALQVRL